MASLPHPPENLRPGLLHWLERLRCIISFSPPPLRQPRRHDTKLARDLERLASASPHLLDDIGFRLDRTSSDPTRTVWQRDGTSVTVAHGERRTVVTGMGPGADRS